MRVGGNRPPSINEQDIDYSSKANGEQGPTKAIAKSAKTTPSRITVYLRLVPDTTIFIFLGLYLVFFLYRAFIITMFPYPFDIGDGAVLNVASRLAMGNSIYRDITELPYISANYTPLYYILNAVAILLSGSSVLAGRLLSVIATFGLATLVFINVRGRTRDRYAAVIASLTLISLGPIYTWGVIYKADMTAVALGILGFHLLNGERPRTVSAALILLAAFYTKQTMLTALVAGALYLTLRALRDRREGWKHFFAYVFTAGGLGLVSFALLNLFTNGQFFTHVVALNVQEILWDQASYALGVFVRSNIVILVFAVFAGASALLKRSDGWSIYFLVSLLALITSVGKVGAYTNYFIESLTIACILFGFGLAQLRQRLPDIVLLPLVILQLALLAHIPYFAEPTPTPKASDFETGSQLVRRISSIEGLMLAENAGWLVTANRPVTIDDTFFFTELARSGKWDQSKLVELIDSRKFSLVLLEFDPTNPQVIAAYHFERFTPVMLDAISNGYRIDQVLGNYYLLVPRDEGSAS